MQRPLFLDVGCLCDHHTDGALEFIAKAIGEDPPGGDIWEPHPNPFIRQLVELFTERGLTRISGLQDELNSWLDGGESRPTAIRPGRPAGSMARWSSDELGLARLYLRSLPAEDWVHDDWLMLIDYLVQRYLPADDIRREADWLATRAGLMGRVQAAMGDVSDELADTVLTALPSLDVVTRRWGITPHQRAAIDYGRARAAEAVTGLADGSRHRMRNMIIDYRQAVYLGDKVGASESLQGRLLDEFGLLNKDWRRIAVTEGTESANQGFVAAAAPGSKIKRVEKYRGACPFCRDLNDRVFTVVDPAAPDKDGELQVWVGKTNIGRSASPRRRIGGALVDREPHEMWWPAAGAMHPHCRGAWLKVGGASADPEFDAWLATLREGKSK